MLTQGCQTQVCDLNACYSASTSSKTFVLAPSYVGPISVHLINNTGQTCQAAIRLDMWNEATPDVVTPSFFFFNSSVSTQDVFRLDEIKVYPNPATEYFVVDNDQVARVRLMSLDGREVAQFNTQQSRQCSVVGQEKGIYTLLMEDSEGKAIGIAQLDIF
jgi:Secretion system C-terminal sorting domain